MLLLLFGGGGARAVFLTLLMLPVFLTLCLLTVPLVLLTWLVLLFVFGVLEVLLVFLNRLGAGISYVVLIASLVFFMRCLCLMMLLVL